MDMDVLHSLSRSGGDKRGQREDIAMAVKFLTDYRTRTRRPVP